MTEANCREAKSESELETAPFIYKFHGPCGQHNYLCSVCRQKKAVLDMDKGILQPCWDCHKTYRVVKIKWFDRLFRKAELR